MKKIGFPLLIIAVAILLNFLIAYLCDWDPRFPQTALMVGNGLMALITLLSWVIVKSSFKSSPQAFVRAMSGSSLLKIFVYIVAILVYVVLNKDVFYKPSIFIFFGLYVVYTAIETGILLYLNKQKSS